VSDDPDVRKNSREQLFKLWGYPKGGETEGGTHYNIVQQFFQRGSGSIVKSMDEIILQKRRERGLPIPKEIENKKEDE
jgi:hypothetical protein